MKIAGMCVLISGGGTGIGRKLAEEFAANNARVAICGRRPEPLTETVKAINENGGEALAVPTDITRPEQVERLHRSLLDSFGPVDMLFNNAGSFRCIAPVHEAEPDDWWQDVTVNLYGAFLLTRTVLPAMLDRDRGVIVNMNGGRPPGGSAYACGKAGLMQLTDILARELELLDSDVIVVNAGPGLVRTEMTMRQAKTEAGRRWIPSTAECFDAGRVRDPEEIASATIRMLETVRPADRGKSYGPDTDFDNW